MHTDSHPRGLGLLCSTSYSCTLPSRDVHSGARTQMGTHTLTHSETHRHRWAHTLLHTQRHTDTLAHRYTDTPTCTCKDSLKKGLGFCSPVEAGQGVKRNREGSSRSYPINFKLQGQSSSQLPGNKEMQPSPSITPELQSWLDSVLSSMAPSLQNSLSD